MGRETVTLARIYEQIPVHCILRGGLKQRHAFTSTLVCQTMTHRCTCYMNNDDAALYAPETDPVYRQILQHRRRTGGATKLSGKRTSVLATRLLVNSSTRRSDLVAASTLSARTRSSAPRRSHYTRRGRTAGGEGCAHGGMSLVLPDGMLHHHLRYQMCRRAVVDPDAGTANCVTKRPKTRRRVTFSDQQGIQNRH
jgi:hypothetical protein